MKEETNQNDKVEVINMNVDSNITNVQLNITKQNIANENGSLTQSHDKTNETNSVDKDGLLIHERMNGSMQHVNNLAQNTTKIPELESSNNEIAEETTLKDAKR